MAILAPTLDKRDLYGVFNLTSGNGCQNSERNRRVFINTLSTNLTGAYTIVQTTGTDGQFSARITFGYTPGKWGTFTLGFSTSQYDYDPNSGSASYKEHTGSLQYSYSF